MNQSVSVRRHLHVPVFLAAAATAATSASAATTATTAAAGAAAGAAILFGDGAEVPADW